MKILIPSRARAHAQTTAHRLAAAGIPFTIVRTLGDDTVYPERFDQVFVEADGIAEKRNKIFELFPGKLLVIDDDIRFLAVLSDGSTMPAEDEDLHDMLRKTEALLDKYAHGGVAMRFMIQNKSRPHVINQPKPKSVLAYNTDLFPTPWPKFRMRACSDIDFNLQLMASGRSFFLVTEYCQQDGPYMAPGGCSVWRTKQVVDEGMRKLKEYWPDYIKLRGGPDDEKGTLATIYIRKMAEDHGLE